MLALSYHRESVFSVITSQKEQKTLLFSVPAWEEQKALPFCVFTPEYQSLQEEFQQNLPRKISPGFPTKKTAAEYAVRTGRHPFIKMKEIRPAQCINHAAVRNRQDYSNPKLVSRVS